MIDIDNIICPNCNKKLKEVDAHELGSVKVHYSLCSCTIYEETTETAVTVEVAKYSDGDFKIELFKYFSEAYMSYIYSKEEGQWDIAIEYYDSEDSEILHQEKGCLEIDEAWRLLNRYYNLKCFL